jgi:hypothetical protein
MRYLTKLFYLLVLVFIALAISFTACGGGGGGDTGGPALPQYTVTTLAGAYDRSIDAVGKAARFSSPYGVYRNGTDIYVVDSGYRGKYNAVRKIDLTTGGVTTFAGDPDQSGGTDGTGKDARFNGPQGITGDGVNLYIADTGNSTIRKIVIATGEVTTIAGEFPVPINPSGSNVDGTGFAARFFMPRGITTDGTNLYITQPYGRTIRKLEIATNAVTTFAGTYTTAVPASIIDDYRTSAIFKFPNGITRVGSYLFISDESCIRRLNLTSGNVSTIVGNKDYHGNDDGTGTSARFYYPRGITSDGTSLYLVDNDYYGETACIRKIDNITSSLATATTVAGGVNPLTGNYNGWSDGIGASAYFNRPQDIATDGTYLYVADTENNSIRKITISTGAVVTIAGHLKNDGTGKEALLDYPYGISNDGSNLYVSNSKAIRKISITTGEVITFAGSIAHPYSEDEVGQKAGFYSPLSMTRDGQNLYLIDMDGYEDVIRKIELATGTVSTLTISGASIDGAGEITYDAGNLYVANKENHTIVKIDKSTGAATVIAGNYGTKGYQDGPGSSALFDYPTGIFCYQNVLYISDLGYKNCRIRKIDLTTNEVTTVAGNDTYGCIDGIGTAASFQYPVSLVCYGNNLYVAEDSSIRKIDLSTTAVVTIAGSTSYGYKDAVGKEALFYYIRGITLVGDALYVTEIINNTVRRIQL